MTGPTRVKGVSVRRADRPATSPWACRRLALILGAVLLLACAWSPGDGEPEPPPPTLTPEVLAVLPHDPTAFTQGLLFHDGYFYESTGLYGRSELRQVEPATGAVVRRSALERHMFGEGLALVNDRLIQLTWQENTALIHDLHTFDRIDSRAYEGEGWGLCHDGRHLYRSDGSSTLYRHDPLTFEVLGTLDVTLAGRPVRHLNELACVGPHIFANVFLTDTIVRIDKHSGRVDARIDAGNLLTELERRDLPAQAVLNGIAHDPCRDVFFLTGKWWPKLFKVRFR